MNKNRRKVLLLEPNYKNKYPPMGLMKLSTYYREYCNDDVRFFKGDLKDFAALLLCEEYLKTLKNKSFGKYTKKIVEYIKSKKSNALISLPEEIDSDTLEKYHIRYKSKAYPKFDIVCVTTLFTFYWKQTIETINFAKELCKSADNVLVGGIAASLVAEHITKETGIVPKIGLLDKPNELDEGIVDENGEPVIIDHLPIDYSILEEIDYKYPANDAYFAYMTRGCVNKCPFCAVPKLEPKYCGYIQLEKQIKQAESRFGAKKDLLLMDNNVFASKHFDEIIDEIKICGFEKNATYTPSNEYDVAFRNLKYNPRAYIKKIINIYDLILERISNDKERGNFYEERELLDLIFAETATIKAIRKFDKTVRPLYEKHFKKIERTRYIDFNQGIDARFVTDAKMKKLSEINIRPLRIAFDNYSKKETYIKAVKLAAKHKIKHLSNYLLYNYEDEPWELYERMRINIELCEELGVTIYSFPMKYHPIDDPRYFRTRDYIGEHWNKKFIRAIQAVLNSTKGKIGKGKIFFEDAFGSDVEEFKKILWMPETFIIYRQKYDKRYREELRERLGDEYRECDSDRDDTNDWWELFSSLTERQKDIVADFVSQNRFFEEIDLPKGKKVQEVLDYYQIRREEN